ncbi:MAG: hypothetical protein WAU78_03725 [Roseiarcus sp.]|jgi:hypothetical protein
MANRLDGLTETVKWHLMVEAAKQGAKSQGYALERLPGRGLSNIWTITKDGKKQRAAIRTTRDRWIAFPPLAKGTKWKTLDEVDVVIVASVDSKEDPENIEVFIFPADEVRKRFDAAYAARKQTGHVIRENFGMWVALDYPKRTPRDAPIAVGSGIADKHKRIAVYSIEKLLAENADSLAAASEDAEEAEALERAEASEPRFTTIAQVMAWTREQIAEIAGVRVEAVKLDLRVEY